MGSCCFGKGQSFPLCAYYFSSGEDWIVKLFGSLFSCYSMFVELEKVRVVLIEMWHRQSEGAHSQIFVVFLSDYLADN